MRIHYALVATAALAGCVTQSRTGDSDPNVQVDAGQYAPADGSLPPDADATGDTQVDPPRFPVTDPQSAAFVGNRLYVASGGRVYVGRLEGEALIFESDAESLSGRELQTGLAALKPISNGLFARRTAWQGEHAVDLVDFNQTPPAVVSHTLFEASDSDMLGTTADGALVCIDGSLHEIRPDGIERSFGTPLCDPRDGREAFGHILMAYDVGAGIRVSTFRLDIFGARRIEGVVNHGFNPTGVHRYGRIVDMKMGPQRAVVDVDSVREFWLVDTQEDAPRRIFQQPLPVQADWSLLAIPQTEAFFDTGAVIAGIDLTDPDAPRRTDRTFSRGGSPDGEGTVRYLTSNAEYVVWRLSDGTLGVYRWDGTPIVIR